MSGLEPFPDQQLSIQRFFKATLYQVIIFELPCLLAQFILVRDIKHPDPHFLFQ